MKNQGCRMVGLGTTAFAAVFLAGFASGKSPSSPTITMPGYNSNGTPQGNNSNNNNNNQNNSDNGNNQQSNVPQDNPALRDAQLKCDADREDVSKAQTALNKIAKPFRDEFAKSPEVLAANKSLQDAEKNIKAAQSAIVASLSSDPTFQTASRKKEVAINQLHKLREIGASPDDLAAAATAVMDAGSALTKLQSDAEKADPALAQSRTDLVEADSKISRLEKENEEALHSNSDWMTAKKALDDAKTKLAASQAALAALEK